MEPAKLIEIMNVAEHLKNATRHSWTSSGRHESVVEHSWRLCLLAFFVKDEFPDADMTKVLKMCLFHDIGESFTGDIPAFEKTAANEQTENVVVCDWITSLPEPYKGELLALFDEMCQRETTEAKIFKALDNMEAVIQHNEADISTWLPLEFDLQLTYGVASAEFSQYLKCLREFVAHESTEKILKFKEQIN